MSLKQLLASVVLLLSISLTIAQPCKRVKPGMSKTEVLKLAGTPTEIDTIFPVTNEDRYRELMVVWQYGNVMNDGNQRVEFRGEKVDSEVIADGKKYDELLLSFQRGEFPEAELIIRINKMNTENCK